MPQRGSQLLAVVGEDLRVVCAAQNGNVGHAAVEQGFAPPTRYRRGSAPGRRAAPGWNDS
jgi:hypothetical protein